MLLLSGGTGTPKLLNGIRQYIPDEEITVIVNTAEDLWVSGNLICPDIDTVIYLFAGMLDTDKWWGVNQDTFHTHKALKMAGHNEILQIGDRDRATHIMRSGFIRQGASLSEAVSRTASMLDAKANILPMCDEPVSSMITVIEGTIHFQEFWVEKAGRPDVLGVEYRGAQTASVSDAIKKAIRHESNIIIGPSNPITSIGPILAVKGMRELILSKHVVAISPIIGYEPVSGPASKLMSACGYEVSSGGVAQCYGDLLDVFIIDKQDKEMKSNIKDMDAAVITADTMMTSSKKSAALARVVLQQLV
jgi:LPPG:FO 2-phospho-L-lactate transferase